MAYNTKPIKIVFGKPIPQHFNPAIDDYEVLLGDNGASRHVLYDSSGNPLSVVSGKLAVRASEVEALLTGLPTTKTAGGNLKAAIVEALPTGDNNIGNVDVVSSALPSGAATEATLTSIKDTAGIKKITDPLPAGTNNIGDVDIASAIPAGSNVIGKVGIDQTTPGVTNGVQVITAIPAGDNNIGNVDVVSSALPAGAATAAKQDTIIGAVDGLENLITAIRDTNGIKKIADALPAGDNNIGNIDVVSTPADAVHGSVHPAKAVLIAGSDGTNARRILTDANGVVQVQLVQSTQDVTMLASAARTTSGDTSATPIDVKKYKEAIFFLDVTAVNGTPTLDVKIKTKDPVSGKWFDLTTFTQATAISSEMKTVSGLLGSQIAAFYTIAGSTPSITFSLGAVLKS